MAVSSTAMTVLNFVMRGRDPRICRSLQMAMSSTAMTEQEKPSAGSSPRVKERWEAGPPRCLLQRVGLVPTSVNFERLTEWVWRPPAGGQEAEARQRSHRHPYLPRCLGDPGTDGSCSTFNMKRSSG